MAADHLVPSSSSILLFLLLLCFPRVSHAQQSYVNNKQLDCNQNYTTTLGFVCNAPAAYCPSYLTFRSTPIYNSPVTIAYLLSADASHIAAINNISDINPLPDDTLVVVPVNCTCSGGNYYQHNASYVLQRNGETYFTVANSTYQSLTTCQSMEAQNPGHYYRDLLPNMTLEVPLRCACPTPNQTAAGFKYLLTYLVRQGDTYEFIADAFYGAGTTVQGILDANELTADRLIFFFTPLLVPLRNEPTYENINAAALPPMASPSPPALPTSPVQQSNGSSSRQLVLVGVGIGIAVFVLFSAGFLIWFLLRRRRRNSPPKLFHPAAEDSRKESSNVNWSLSSEGIRSSLETLTLYRFEELEKATGSFSESNRIGSSSVYRGSFNGDYAAVKIMKGDVSREIEVLRQINHSHIIRLSGFCLHQGITYLIYEYAPNGSLYDFLRFKDSGLDWKQRVQIAYDIADALNYLHNFTNPPYIHKNLKSSNVLLDTNFRAKVANFGLARTLENDDMPLTRHVVGTYGYMAPEYIENGLVTPKLDVFALGVVILELLSGKEPVINEEGDELLCTSVEGVMGGENVREKLREFINPWLAEDYYPLDLAYSMTELARRCVASDLNERPVMSEVLMALTRLLSSSLDWDPSHEQRSTSFSLSE